MSTATTPPRHVRVGILGQTRAGKTSLRRHLAGEAFQEDEKSTLGAELTDIRTQDVTTDVWATIHTAVSTILSACVVANSLRFIQGVESTGEPKASELSNAVPIVTYFLFCGASLFHLGFLGWLFQFAVVAYLHHVTVSSSYLAAHFSIKCKSTHLLERPSYCTDDFIFSDL